LSLKDLGSSFDEFHGTHKCRSSAQILVQTYVTYKKILLEKTNPLFKKEGLIGHCCFTGP
jgi:hypothetical protein